MTEPDFPELVRAHVLVQAGGNVSKWARMNGLSQSYASALVNGLKGPGDELLAKMGLKRIVCYVPVDD